MGDFRERKIEEVGEGEMRGLQQVLVGFHLSISIF